MPKIPIQFGEFAPDAVEYDNAYLEDVENAIPMYGGYRSIRTAEVQSTETDHGNYVTGAHAHVITVDVNVQHGKANSTTSSGTWFRKKTLAGGSFLHLDVDELVPDDVGSYVYRMASDANGGTHTEARLEIEDLTDPGGTANSDYHLDVRYRGFIDDTAGTGTLTVALYQGVTHISTVADWTASGDEDYWDGTWKTKRFTIANADADNITDFTDLNIRLQSSMTAAAQDDQIHYPQADDFDNRLDLTTPIDVWQREDDSETDFYLSLQSVTSFGDTPDDDVYVVTKPNIDVSGDFDALMRVALDGARIPYGEFDGVQLKVRGKVTDHTANQLGVKYGDLADEGLQSFAASNTWETLSFNVSTAVCLKWCDEPDDGTDDWSKFPVELYVAGLASGTTETSNPKSSTTPNTWESSTGGSAVHTDINASGGAYALADGTGTDTYRFKMDALSEPGNHLNTKVEIKFRFTGGTNRPTVAWKIYYNGTSNSYQKSYQCTTDWQTKTFTLPESISQALDWGTDFTVELIKNSGSFDREVQVDYIKITSPGGTDRCYIGDVWLEVPNAQGFQVTWCDLVIPSSGSDTTGDSIRIYAGTKEKLYKVSEEGWVNRTRTASDYGQGVDEPQAWDFCSWGGNVIATNFEDDVQLLDLEAGAVNFAKLSAASTASEYTIKAKFCKIVQNHLVLANIGDVVDGTAGAFTDAYAYSVWWSHINDPTLFEIGDYENLSDLQHLRDTPGEITGLVGGEFGTIFKRNSIHRMSWVGGNLVFRFDVLARGIGTAHPKSIVDVMGDIYFFGHNDFYVMPQGGKPQPISQGKIKAMLLESAWGERAINRDSYTLQVDNDLRVVGTYDPFSGLIFWCIDNYHANSDFYLKSDIVVYNPVDGRFGYIRDARFSGLATRGISYIVASPNVQQDHVGLLNNLNLFTYYDLGATNIRNMEKFIGYYYLPMTVVTNTISSSKIGGSDTGSLTRIRSVRPFYDRIKHRDYDSDSDGPVLDIPYTVTAYSSYDPLMVDDVSTATAEKTDENKNHWSSLSKILTGEFWKFKVVIPQWIPTAGTSTYGAVKSLLGLQVDAEQEGDN